MARMTKSKKENSILEDGKRNVLQVIFSRTMLIMILIVLQFAYLVGKVYAYAEFVPIFLGSEFLLVAMMLAVILNTKENPAIKLSWCFLVGVFPIFGSIVYLVIRYDLGYRMQQKRIQITEKEARKYMPEQQEMMEELKHIDMQTYHIAAYLQKESGSAVSKGNDVTYFPIGELQFEEMVRQLEDAREFIFLEYFMIAQGQMWRTILDVLIRKVKEGVDVRVLYDGSCSIYLLPYSYPKKLQKEGIKCKMFSPPIPFFSTHYNNRDHRKIMVIDGKVAFTGGINICDEYINVDSPCGHWKDVGIMLRGDAVREFTRMFLQMWSATEQKPVIEERFLLFHSASTDLSERKAALTSQDASVKVPYSMETGQSEKEPSFASRKSETIETYRDCESKGYVIPYGDSPVDQENVGEMVYLDILNQAKKYVHIMTPYLILDHEMQTALIFAAKRGIDVQIILPHIPDKKYAFVLAKGHYQELIEAGVKIYEYTPGFVHAKVFVCDDCRAVIGTVNLDYRSLYWHYECAAYLYQVPAVTDIQEDYQKTLKKCQQVTLEEVNKRGIFSRFAGAVLKLVAPLM